MFIISTIWRTENQDKGYKKPAVSAISFELLCQNKSREDMLKLMGEEKIKRELRFL